MMTRALTAATLAAFSATTVSAETTWRFNNNYAPTRPESAHIRAFAEDVSTRTAGSLKIEVIEGGGMNLKDADALRWMQTGTPEIAFIWPTFIGRDAPDLASLYVYGSVSTAEEHLKALPAVKQALTEGFTERDIPVIGFMALPIIDASLFCREPVTSLAELRTKKLRVGSREQVETFTALGVAAQIVPQNELYAALQTGVVDCALYAARFAKSISLQEVTKFATYSGFPFPPVPYAIVVNKGALAKLTDAERGALTEATLQLETNSSDFSKDAAAEAAARAELTAAGVTWAEPLSTADVEEIRTAATTTWETLSTEGGDKALAYRKTILDLLTK
jgi:TRAP-type C4-dicarboxylate transport system substrate-binding protein